MAKFDHKEAANQMVQAMLNTTMPADPFYINKLCQSRIEELDRIQTRLIQSFFHLIFTKYQRSWFGLCKGIDYERINEDGYLESWLNRDEQLAWHEIKTFGKHYRLVLRQVERLCAEALKTKKEITISAYVFMLIDADINGDGVLNWDTINER